LIKADGLRARIKKDRRHSASPRICFCVVHERASAAGPALACFNDDVIYVKMRAARQGVNWPHTKNPDDSALSKRSNEFVAAMVLLSNMPEKLLLIETRAQLRDY
jgi:hypothetical protein